MDKYVLITSVARFPYVVYTLYMDDGRWNMMFGEMVMMIALLICGIVRG